MILYCQGCKPNKFQDETYGYKKRVMNKCEKAGEYRCTVCLKTRMGDGGEKAEKKK